ncbi:MAG: type II toxin-antitoxin system RelE/ParE family toxin [Thiomicrospira sp.]|uniref:type II toxin-antitoxin system RelE/ParE family toxin n=1 Tax=Thiomicrospira sp. TaxID=935 RepID=UPI0019EA55A1|nr:type II toxin-antitoxin system RelE/ParE family toxin [Thiomicrospira sp.]MBE0494298.1 type II toxin-antitoxin system RelE/ParE family toxin [Thiomicrospira sp.]
MAEVIWAESALADLDEIADYIALDNPRAAQKWVKNLIGKVRLLAEFPELGTQPEELVDFDYRQLLVKPCRIFYRFNQSTQQVYILHLIRQEKEVLNFLKNIQ